MILLPDLIAAFKPWMIHSSLISRTMVSSSMSQRRASTCVPPLAFWTRISTAPSCFGFLLFFDKHVFAVSGRPLRLVRYSFRSLWSPLTHVGPAAIVTGESVRNGSTCGIDDTRFHDRVKHWELGCWRSGCTDNIAPACEVYR
jgi:hypothetical protein